MPSNHVPQCHINVSWTPPGTVTPPLSCAAVSLHHHFLRRVSKEQWPTRPAGPTETRHCPFTEFPCMHTTVGFSPPFSSHGELGLSKEVKVLPTACLAQLTAASRTQTIHLCDLAQFPHHTWILGCWKVTPKVYLNELSDCFLYSGDLCKPCTI